MNIKGAIRYKKPIADAIARKYSRNRLYSLQQNYIDYGETFQSFCFEIWRGICSDNKLIEDTKELPQLSGKALLYILSIVLENYIW